MSRGVLAAVRLPTRRSTLPLDEKTIPLSARRLSLPSLTTLPPRHCSCGGGERSAQGALPQLFRASFTGSLYP